MIFKKKPKNSVALDKLKVDTTLKCNKISWKIAEVTRYDWSTDGHSLEYKLVSTDGKNHEAFLEVERVIGGYEILFYEWVSIDGIQLLEAINSRNITYIDTLFKLEEQYKGSFKNETLRTEWHPVESFIFYNDDDAMLSIEKTEEKGCQAFYGFELEEKSISAIVIHKK